MVVADIFGLEVASGISSDCVGKANLAVVAVSLMAQSFSADRAHRFMLYIYSGQGVVVVSGSPR